MELLDVERATLLELLQESAMQRFTTLGLTKF